MNSGFNKKKTTPLRERMREDLRLRNYSKHSEELYLFHARKFAPPARYHHPFLVCHWNIWMYRITHSLDLC